MSKYLLKVYYSSAGAAGVAEKGGTIRSELVGKMAADVGASLDALYFAFGDTDAYAIVDAPSDEVMAGIALRINSSGATKIVTTPLLTPEQIDKATETSFSYTPPGQ